MTPEREPLLSEERIRELAIMATNDTGAGMPLMDPCAEQAIRQACRETAEACAKVCDRKANEGRAVWDAYISKCRENPENIGVGSTSWHQYFESCAAAIRAKVQK